MSFRSSIFYIYCKCLHVILPQCFRYKLAFFLFRLLHLHIPMKSTSIFASHPPHPPCIQKMGPDAQPTFHVVNTWSSSPYIHATLLSDANDLAYLVDARNLFGYFPCFDTRNGGGSTATILLSSARYLIYCLVNYPQLPYTTKNPIHQHGREVCKAMSERYSWTRIVGIKGYDPFVILGGCDSP